MNNLCLLDSGLLDEALIIGIHRDAPTKGQKAYQSNGQSQGCSEVVPEAMAISISILLGCR